MMHSRTTTKSGIRSRPRLWVLGAAVAAAGLLLAGSPARAGDFKDCFQDPLARIAAFQLARAGHVLLTVGLDPYARHHTRYDTRHRYRPAVRHGWRHARLHRRHRLHQRNARGYRVLEHFHAPGEPCGYEDADTGRHRYASEAYVYERYERRR